MSNRVQNQSLLRRTAVTSQSVSALPSEDRPMLKRWLHETQPTEMTLSERLEKRKWENTMMEYTKGPEGN